MSAGGSHLSMHRLILGYVPANIVPAAVSVISIIVFTRLLSTQAFGAYNLAFSVMMVAQSVLFFAHNLALTRFYASAADEAATRVFLKTMYTMFLAIAAVAVVVAIVAAVLARNSPFRAEFGDTMWLILPLLLLRALVGTNQTVNRAANRMARFNGIECLHALVGLAAGILLVRLGMPTGGAVVAGLVAGALICAGLDIGLLRNLWARVAIDRATLVEVLEFCWPLVLSYAVGCTLQYADRFIVSSDNGAAALGVYVVAFSLVDRPISLICLSVAAGTFQVAVDTYIQEGPQAGRIQAGRNGAALLGLTVPACIGLMLTNRAIAGVLVGAEFREGVAALIPIMAVTSLLRGFAQHYVEHAFHLANRSRRLFAVYAPSAVGNILLSALLVPRFGMVAAAYSALACQALAILVGWWAAQRVLPLWLPGREIARIGVCAAAMTAALLAIPRPSGLLGLSVSIAVGVVSYVGSGLIVNLGGIRGLLLGRLTRQDRDVTGAPLSAPPETPPHVPV
jgi:O-antigen/teichoic acid export membrane protein